MNLKFIFIFMIFVTSCNNNISPENIHHQSWKYPVVERIFFTDENGNRLAEWYNPYVNSNKSNSYIINNNSQPNLKTSQNSLQISNSPLVKPTAITTFEFQLPKRTHVLMYIVPAVLNPKDSDPSQNSNGSFVNIPGGLSIKKLVDREFDTGYHAIIWDATDEFGNTVDTGFYRSYFVTENFEKYYDLLFVIDRCEIPFEIRPMFTNFFPCNK